VYKNHPEVLQALLSHPRGHTISSLALYFHDALEFLHHRSVAVPLRRADQILSNTAVIEILLDHPDLDINLELINEVGFVAHIEHKVNSLAPSTLLTFAIQCGMSKVVSLMLAHKNLELPMPKYFHVHDYDHMLVISPLVYAVLLDLGHLNPGMQSRRLKIVASLLRDGRCDVSHDFDQIIRIASAHDGGGESGYESYEGDEELSSKQSFLMEFLRFEARRLRHQLLCANFVCESRGLPAEIFEACIRPCLIQNLVQPAHVKIILALPKVDDGFKRKVVQFVSFFDDVSRFDIPESYLKELRLEK